MRSRERVGRGSQMAVALPDRQAVVLPAIGPWYEIVQLRTATGARPFSSRNCNEQARAVECDPVL